MVKIFQLQRLIFIPILFMFFMSKVLIAAPVYDLKISQQPLSSYLYRFVNESEKLTAKDVVDINNKNWLQQVVDNGDVLLKNGGNWFYFEFTNTSAKPKRAYLTLTNQVRILDVQLYTNTETQQLVVQKMVLNLNNTRSAELLVESYSKKRLYLFIDSSTNLRASINIFNESTYLEENSEAQFFHGLAVGGVSCLALTMMLLFFGSGNKTIFAVLGYFTCRALLLSVLLGGNLYYLMPDFPELRGIEFPLLIAASSIFLLLFTGRLFYLKVKFPSAYEGIRWTCWVLLIYMPLSMLFSIDFNISISMLIYSVVTLVLIFIGVYLNKQKQRLALLFAVVMGIQFLFGVVNVIGVNWVGIGFIEHRAVFYTLMFWLNALLIIFMLSRQYYFQLKDKQQAQRQALKNLTSSEHAQEQLLKLQQENQEQLEIRVQERTLELNIALQELESANQELEQKNTLDELSGLYNRRFYDQKILAEYRRSKRNLTPLSLVIIDIDHFKSVNDTYGHLTGDQCLIWLSNHIKQSLKRSSDIAFRYGGEEFCLILPDTESQGAQALAENLRKSIAETAFCYKDVEITLTISCGISTYQQQTDIQPEQIFAGADKALYKAKHNGRNQIQQHQFIEE